MTCSFTPKQFAKGSTPSAKSVNYIIGGEYSHVKFECQRAIVNSDGRPGKACFKEPSGGEFRVAGQLSLITNSGRAGNGVVWRGYVNDSWNRSGIAWLHPEWRTTMARKSKLTRVAVGIGTAMGKADRGVQKVAKAGSLAKRELDDISKQVDALKRQLQKTAKRLKRALS